MLVHLAVKDLALIEQVELSFGKGLTVLTGETGAGKSILVEALLVLFGGRASAEQVRSGADEGSVSAQLSLCGEDRVRVAAVLDELGLPPLEPGAEDEGLLLLRRVLSKEGRHRQWVNGALSTVAQLKAVAEPLVDFTGQHAHQALVRPGAQQALLDSFAGHEALLGRMAEAHADARRVAAELAELQEKNADKARRLDVARFYLDEIHAVDPKPGEDVELSSERKRLANAERLRASLDEARTVLCDGADDAMSALQRGQSALERAARDDDTLAAPLQTLREAIALVDDVARTLQKADVELDAERLVAVEDRLDALQRLSKKHGGDIEQVLAKRDALEAEVQSLDGAAERIEHLVVAAAAAVDEAAAAADALTAKRKAAAKKLAAAMAAELPALGMKDARVEIAVEPLADDGKARLTRADGRPLSSTGADRVEVLFSANAGEAPQPLSRVASGGELSRVLLALKRAVLLRDPVPVSIFDEVDAGVGGAVASAIGDKLQAIAADGGGGVARQVLCITHLAQIACKADAHLLVEKAVVAGRTVSRVRALDDRAREDELARMIGGRDITDATRRHAREMLEHGRRGPAASSSSERALRGDGPQAGKKKRTA